MTPSELSSAIQTAMHRTEGGTYQASHLRDITELAGKLIIIQFSFSKISYLIPETPLAPNQQLDSSVVQAAVDGDNEPDYLINGYRRDWYEILRTRDENRGFISSLTPTPEQLPRRRRRRVGDRNLSPVFDTPPIPKRSLRAASPPPEINGNHTNEGGIPITSEMPSNQVMITENLQDNPIELEIHSNGNDLEAHSAQTGEIPLSETEKLLRSFESGWLKKMENGAEMPIWWSKRDKYMRGIIQRVKDVQTVQIYPVAQTSDMKVCRLI